MDQKLATLVNNWHSVNGGHFERPAGHALRLLCEVVELCIAAGAQPAELTETVQSEMVKATSKGEWLGEDDLINFFTIGEEWADSAILLEVFRNYAHIDGDTEVEDKHQVLLGRDWEVDRDGVLWRPGKGPGHG